jgi:DHA1 family multidrug resistance protein-like MFS transporter
VKAAIHRSCSFDSKTDPENPKNWTFRRKVRRTGAFAVACIDGVSAGLDYHALRSNNHDEHVRIISAKPGHRFLQQGIRCDCFIGEVHPVTHARRIGISTEVGILGLSLFIAGYVPGPVLFAPLSELYGRKISVLVPMFIFICFSAATATAENLQTIFIVRDLTMFLESDC